MTDVVKRKIGDCFVNKNNIFGRISQKNIQKQEEMKRNLLFQVGVLLHFLKKCCESTIITKNEKGGREHEEKGTET